MPCASSEDLEALITGGVEAYRERNPEVKGLLGRAIKKVTRVRVDPDAIDADGDGLVQDGTSAERPFRKVRKSVTSGVRSATRSGEKKRTVSADIERMNAHFNGLLDRVDNEITSLGGLGRYRHSGEGPAPEMVSRMAEVDAVVLEKFGETKTIAQIEAALGKAFPNAKIDLRNLVDDDPSNPQAMIKPINASAPQRDIGGTRKEILQGLQGFAHALMFKASEDPDSAALVGSVRLIENRPDAEAASVSMSIANKAAAPIAIVYNPEAPRLSRVSSAQTALVASAKLRDDLENRDKIKQTGTGNWITGEGIFADSDPKAQTMWTGFHEWAHLKGLSLSLKDSDPESMKKLQDWVATGKDDGVFEAFPELSEIDSYLQDRLTQAFANGGGFDGNASGYLERLGFQNVDLSNQEQLRQVYRAIAARNVLAETLMMELDARAAKLQDDWSSFDTVSGYGNVDVEEGIAELVALASAVPDIAKSKYGDALKLPQIKERL